MKAITALLVSLLMTFSVQAQQEDTLHLKKAIITFKLSKGSQQKIEGDTSLLKSYFNHQTDLNGIKREGIHFYNAVKPLKPSNQKTYQLVIDDREVGATFQTEAIIPDQIEAIIPDQIELVGSDLQEDNSERNLPDKMSGIRLQNLKMPRPFDSRFELACLSMRTSGNQNVITNSFSVLGVLSVSQLKEFKNGTTVSNVITLGERFGLCPSEPFFNQPVICTGTAFLIAPNFILTAYHNLNQISIKEMRFVKGFKMMTCEGQDANLFFEKNDIYSGVELMQSDKLAKMDLAMIRIERRVQGAIPLLIRDKFNPKPNYPVYALGYPMGLPMKFIANASVREVEGNFSFYTTLDTYQGNSGSPVFDEMTHEVVGVLTGGGVDFKSKGDCFESNLCADRSCKGERVVNISAIKNEIMSLIDQNSSKKNK